MNFPDAIFKAYDIRGLVEGELSPELAYQLGRAFPMFLQQKGYTLAGRSLVVGYDMRPTSIPFQTQLVAGITDAGMDVVEIGMTSTPLFNFSVAHYAQHVGGVMVTASHNPAEYNGFKIALENGLPVGKDNGLEEIKTMVRQSFPPVEKKGRVMQKNTLSDYVAHIFSLVPVESIGRHKVVVDYGNGMGSVVLPEVVKHLPIEVIPLYDTPDGTFPHHEANPLKESTLRDLQAKVIEVGADIGFALDGDADRIGLVDNTGAVVPPSFLGALLGREVLAVHPGGRMFYVLTSSDIVPEVWHEFGGDPEKCEVGRANIIRHMKEKQGVFGSELSMHFFFADMYDLESSDLCLLYFLRLLTEEAKPLTEILKPLQKYFHSGEINFEVEDKAGKMQEILQKYKSEAIETSDLDGVYLRFGWGWLSVRQSNTEPVLRLNLEANTQQMMADKVAELSNLLSQT